jgi:hypothetical protein
LGHVFQYHAGAAAGKCASTTRRKCALAKKRALCKVPREVRFLRLQLTVAP